MSKFKCSCCGEEVDPHKCNGIYKKGSHKYYCKKKKCQERFIEDAGDPPDYEYGDESEAK